MKMGQSSQMKSINMIINGDIIIIKSTKILQMNFGRILKFKKGIINGMEKK